MVAQFKLCIYTFLLKKKHFSGSFFSFLGVFSIEIIRSTVHSGSTKSTYDWQQTKELHIEIEGKGITEKKPPKWTTQSHRQKRENGKRDNTKKSERKEQNLWLQYKWFIIQNHNWIDASVLKVAHDLFSFVFNNYFIVCWSSFSVNFIWTNDENKARTEKEI